MGKRTSKQAPMFVAATELPVSPGRPFYAKLNTILDGAGFDRFAEEQCQRFHAPVMGRPSLPPGRYVRLLLVGHFEGLDSERGMAWRAADSLAVRTFVGRDLDTAAPDHSTISRTRRLLALDGVVTAVDDGLAFHATPLPADAEVTQLVNRIRSRVLHCARAIGASALLFVMGIAAEAAPPAPVSLRVLAPRAVSVNQPRDISVLITNGGATRAMVLPNMVRLRIEGIGAEYVPYPGPPIDPWGGARDLAPGATATIPFPDTSDKRGVWRLPPGEYRITAVYEVPPDLSPPATIADPSQVWRGRLESPPATMTVK